MKYFTQKRTGVMLMPLVCSILLNWPTHAKDNRQELKMTQEMKDFQFATMRKSLDHSANFILALQKKDFKKLKEIVKEFGHTPEKKKLAQGIEARNPGFKNMAKAHQKSVKRLKAFVEEENADKSLKQFGLVMKTCVQCHSLYKTVVIP